jgi:hypothetical protein
MSVALIIGLGVIILIAAIAMSQRSGPRVTHIETRRESEEGEERE